MRLPPLPSATRSFVKVHRFRRGPLLRRGRGPWVDRVAPTRVKGYCFTGPAGLGPGLSIARRRPSHAPALRSDRVYYRTPPPSSSAVRSRPARPPRSFRKTFTRVPARAPPRRPQGPPRPAPTSRPTPSPTLGFAAYPFPTFPLPFPALYLPLPRPAPTPGPTSDLPLTHLAHSSPGPPQGPRLSLPKRPFRPFVQPQDPARRFLPAPRQSHVYPPLPCPTPDTSPRPNPRAHVDPSPVPSTDVFPRPNSRVHVCSSPTRLPHSSPRPDPRPRDDPRGRAGPWQARTGLGSHLSAALQCPRRLDTDLGLDIYSTFHGRRRPASRMLGVREEAAGLQWGRRVCLSYDVCGGL